MPHESTVAHEQRFVMESPMISRSRTFSVIDDDSSENNVNHHHVSILWAFFIHVTCIQLCYSKSFPASIKHLGRKKYETLKQEQKVCSHLKYTYS
jgi:hypothetical protein